MNINYVLPLNFAESGKYPTIIEKIINCTEKFKKLLQICANCRNDPEYTVYTIVLFDKLFYNYRDAIKMNTWLKQMYPSIYMCLRQNLEDLGTINGKNYISPQIDFMLSKSL